jgi:hypothetical protein
MSHPITESSGNKVAGSILAVGITAIRYGLLVFYGKVEWTPALVDSVLSTGLLVAAGYTVWYALAFISVWQAHAALALSVQFICAGVSYTVLSLAGMGDTESFLTTLPLSLLFGLLCWIILLQWYGMKRQQAEQIQQQEGKAVERQPEGGGPAADVQDVIDRISVKDGSRIHLIHPGELFCLQASGDYVTLFTPSGQFIKEQTMKYFETHLPSAFVRIHRSTIVNTEHIIRVELFGKENYQVKLKNGMSLRASITGYKLLKERLAL